MDGYLFHDPQRLQKEMILVFDIWLELFVRVRVDELRLRSLRERHTFGIYLAT